MSKKEVGAEVLFMFSSSLIKKKTLGLEFGQLPYPSPGALMRNEYGNGEKGMMSRTKRHGEVTVRGASG